MKKGYFLVALIALSMSCKKANELTDIKAQIVGTWELERYSCGECPPSLQTFPPINRKLIIVSSDGTFERRVGDSVAFKGNYSIKRSTECNKSGDPAFLTNESSNASPLFIRFDGDKLMLSTPYCYTDGAVSIYHRYNTLPQ
jgi:hypothetical protein